MTCKVIVGATVQIFSCDPWEGYMAQLARESDEDWAVMELEANVDDAAGFQVREPEFSDMRAEVDPYWPPRELPSRFEEAERDPAITYQGDL